jgi:hypothetical protein
MRRILLAIALLSPLWASSAWAVDCQYRATSPTLPDQQFIILQCDSAGKLLTTQTPSSATSAGLTPVVSAASESSHVFKASAGNLYAYQVTTGAVAGFIMIFNATSAPADGAVAPVKCVTVAANSTVGVSMSPPEAFATGITAVFSTTGCFVKTASATAVFSGDVK